MPNTLWKPHKTPNAEAVELLKNEINAPDIIAQMLVQRGIDTVPKVRAFFNPRIAGYA